MYVTGHSRGVFLKKKQSKYILICFVFLLVFFCYLDPYILKLTSIFALPQVLLQFLCLW